MGQIVLSSGLTYAHQNIGAGGTKYELHRQSGSYPDASYRITAATLRVTVRNPNWMTWVFRDGGGAELGRMPIEGGGGERETLLRTDYAYSWPMDLWIYGEGSAGAQLQGATYVTLTIDWEVTTTACTPPASVTLDHALAEIGTTLRWSGAAGGTNNAIQQYGVEYRDSGDGSLWGSWQVLSFVQSTSGSGSLAVTPPGSPGHLRQYRVATIGTAGVPYASPWAEQQPILRRNSPPSTPTNLAASPAVWESGSITLTWDASTDLDGNLSGYQLVYRSSLDGYVAAQVVSGVTASPYVHATTLQRGEIIQYYLRAVDALGAASDWVASNTVTGNQLPGAPSGVTAAPALWETGEVTIQWQPASDPEGAVTYQVVASVSGDGSTWGTAQPVGTTADTAITHTPVLPRGAYIRYSVCAVDTHGAASPWVAANLVRRNQLPGVPTVDYPAAGAVLPGGRMAYQVTIPPDPDGGSLTLLLQVGQTWHALGTSTGGVLRGRLPEALPTGIHVLTFVLRDGLGATSTAAPRQVTVTPSTWGRAIAPGVVIANATISHRADLRELAAAINRLRVNVGLDAIALPGTIGRWADWRGQMLAMQAALTVYHQRIGDAAPSWAAVPRYPTAAVINQLREAVTAG